MATVRAFVRTTKRGGKSKIRFRLRDGATVQLFHVSEIEVRPEVWDAAKEEVKAKVVIPAPERLRINKAVSERKALVAEVYHSAPSGTAVTSAWLSEEIRRRLERGAHGVGAEEEGFFELFKRFIEVRPVSELRKNSFVTLMRTLRRYEMYKQVTGDGRFQLTMSGFTAETLRDFEAFLKEEPNIAQYYPELYVDFHATLKERGLNYRGALLSRLRTFFKWAAAVGVAATDPFRNFQLQKGVYGTPYYLTIEERNQVAAVEVGGSLAECRDTFIFQCLVGCRVGDLMKFTPANVANETLEYIPHKTRDGRPLVLRVPLGRQALGIIARYKGKCGDRLLPVRDLKAYNEGIREVLAMAGVERMVTVLNTVTRAEEHKRICDIASSHLARRTFIGNLYKKVKDPNLIGALSGHREGSTSFARYRTIDEEMKVELIGLLE